MFAQNQQNTLPTTGNVGVGTLTPNVKLQVNGSMKVDSSLTVKDTAVFEKQARMKGKIVVESDAVILGTLKAKSDLKVEGTAKLEGDVKMTNLSTANNNDTTLLFVNQNGKVKAGDIGDLLDKIGNSPANKSMLTKMIYSDPCVLSNDQSSLQALTTTSNYYPVWANKVGVLWTGLPCPAQVGIGTDDPQANLDVVGSGHFGSNVGVGTARQTGTSLVVKTDGHQGNGYYAAKFITHFSDNKALAVENAAINKEMFTLYGDGSFQFSNATDKILQLDNTGLLHARHVKVDLDAWPDYVFEKHYTLPTLRETEHYIQQNGHLPNVPSAKEVVQNGLDLGEMNKILLQKVEELTLHLIQQEKAMQNQEQRIAELEKALQSKKTTKP